MAVVLSNPFAGSNSNYISFMSLITKITNCLMRLLLLYPIGFKGPVKQIQWMIIVKSVPLYHLKLVYVVLYMVVKEFLETHF